jgi:hypothetical protein
MASDNIAEGLASLNSKLTKKLPEKVYNQVRAVLAAQADKIVSQMKRHAPVDRGDLQMSISWCWGNAPKGTMTVGSVGTGKGGRSFKQGKDTTGLRISIFAGGGDEYYAWFQEFGTQNIGGYAVLLSNLPRQQAGRQVSD